MEDLTRRTMLQNSLAALAGMRAGNAIAAAPSMHMDLLREPDLVRAFIGQNAAEVILHAGGGRWTGGPVTVETERSPGELTCWVAAGEVPLHRLHLRWNQPTAADSIVLGDAWERSYGDLAWLPLQPDRVLPWYFLAQTRGNTFGAGVKTGAGSFAFWQVDREGISLWFDVRCGGEGVRLGARRLHAGTLVQQAEAGQGSWLAARALCKAMAKGSKVPRRRGTYDLGAIYGSNDWYYAYGKNTPEGILRDATLMQELAPSKGPKPFTVIDDGYQDPKIFPSMQRLAEQIRQGGVAPGIWIRPLRAATNEPASLLLPAARWGRRRDEPAFDPTIPEARERILAVVTQACDWGYDFIKHDFTTYELLGQWGSSMGASPTQGTWAFHDKTQTSAEILRGLYADIRQSAGVDRIILGCNTVGHLAVGLFDGQRTGDDVSGRNWERTRRMGVNTLAFRLPQNGVFFATDADCVPITLEIPWHLTADWLKAVAASGSILLVSPDPAAMGAEQKRALRRAFATCTLEPASEPLDWTTTQTPSRWKTRGGIRNFEWLDPSGASPFPI